MPGSRWWNCRVGCSAQKAPPCPHPHAHPSSPTHWQHGIEEVCNEGSPALYSFLGHLQVSLRVPCMNAWPAQLSLSLSPIRPQMPPLGPLT